ncbi:MAG: Xaa-Pro peptidase family protein [Desulfovibrionaceae bacterium]|nr:Xaa-Pro peptidase family protein [Desulfovibrionaceae bacterium]
MIDRTVFAQRREKLRRLMKIKKFDALLISGATNRYYLSGFELHDPQPGESAGCLLITLRHGDWLCTDGRYTDAAARLWDVNKILQYRGNAASEIGALASGLSGVCTVGIETRLVSHDFYLDFEAAAKGCSLERGDYLAEELRLFKDEEEIRLMKASCRLNHEMLAWLPAILQPGRSEAEVAWEIEKYFREHGAEELAFPSIVGVDRNAALPHCIPSHDTVIQEDCMVLTDVGCRLNRYCSDQTRVFWIGDHPSDQYLRTLDAVREAQNRAIQTMHPGMKTSDADAVARKYFAELGLDAHFTHGLGHGVGLETHEPPSLHARNKMTLEPGMIVTVEPGLYFPEWGGIRWEYMVLIREDGVEIL